MHDDIVIAEAFDQQNPTLVQHSALDLTSHQNHSSEVARVLSRSEHPLLNLLQSMRRRVMVLRKRVRAHIHSPLLLPTHDTIRQPYSREAVGDQATQGESN
jgi:hypothetical protein